MTSAIGSRRKQFWEDNGFLVFPGFLDHEEIDEITDAYDRTWREAPPHVVVDDLVINRRSKISELDDSQREHHFKVNDLYLSEPGLRDVALSERLGLVMEELLDDEPTICNTLNFDKGSQQPDHLDTLFMTPASERGLAASWIALEDTTADAGPLRYYPGSNKIAPYRFSNGSMRQLEAEMPPWSDYMAEEVERRGLEEQRFLAHKGDLFIWHALLLHGGSAIADPASTRQSMVTHYWTQTDCELGPWDLRPCPGGWWIHKPPLQTPRSPTDVRADDEVIDFPSLTPEADPNAEDLRDRMDALQGATD